MRDKQGKKKKKKKKKKIMLKGVFAENDSRV